MLIDDRNQINYITVEPTDEIYSNVTNFLLCSPFDEIKLHDPLGRRNWPANEEVSVKAFLNRSIQSIEARINRTGLFNRLHSYVFNRHVCFRVNKSDLEKEARFAPYLKTYFVRLFAFSISKIPYFYENIHEKANARDRFLLLMHKQKVYHERYLSNANCFNFTDQYRMNRFICLNFCFKKIEKFNRGFYPYHDHYNPNEYMTFNLSHIAHGVQSEYLEPEEKEFKEMHKACVRKCPENDCFWVGEISLLSIVPNKG